MHMTLFLSYNLNKDLISTLGWVSWAGMYLLSSAIIGTKYSLQVGTRIRLEMKWSIPILQVLFSTNTFQINEISHSIFIFIYY